MTSEHETRRRVLIVPGIVYDEFIEGSGVPIEESWPEPVRWRKGNGYRYRYEVTDEQRRLIMSHIEDYAHSSSGYDYDDRGRVAGRTAFAWLANERANDAGS